MIKSQSSRLSGISCILAARRNGDTRRPRRRRRWKSMPRDLSPRAGWSTIIPRKRLSVNADPSEQNTWRAKFHDHARGNDH